MTAQLPAQESLMKVQYEHAYTTRDLLERRSNNVMAEIKACVNNTACKLTAIGQNDGRITYWRPRRWNIDDAKSNAADDKLVCYEFVTDPMRRISIECLCLALADIVDAHDQQNSHGLLVSGSADGCIKLWDPWHRHENSKHSAVCTLKGYHGGTILYLAYNSKQQLISSSTDNTVRIWRVQTVDETGYPQLSCQQVIQLDTWCRSISSCIKHLLVANDDGILCAYKHSQTTKTTTYQLESQRKLHRLSVTFMLYVGSTNHIITLSNDQTLRVHDASSFSPIFGVRNPENCKYLAADYNVDYKELYVVDEHGMLQIWNLRRELLLYAQQLRKAPLFYIQCVSASRVMVCSADCVEVWSLSRVQRPKHGRGHAGDVISLVVIGASAHSQSHDVSPQAHAFDQNLSMEDLENNLRDLDTVLYSVGTDNSIRCWDIGTMQCRAMLDTENRESSLSEISTMIHLPGSRSLLTGHHNGAIYVWNTDNASNMKLPQVHNDAVTGIMHSENNTQKLFSIGQDGVLAVYGIATKEDERAFHWQGSVVLSEQHSLLSICCDEHHCYIGDDNGDVYQYHIEQAEVCTIFRCGRYQTIVALALDAHFLFIACASGEMIVFELMSNYKLDEIRTTNQKCIGCQFMLCESTSHLLVIVYEHRILVYDYTIGEILEQSDSEDCITSFTLHGGVICLGYKNASVASIQLRSFLSGDTPETMSADTLSSCTNTSSMLDDHGKTETIVDKRNNPAMLDWRKGERSFTVSFDVY